MKYKGNMIVILSLFSLLFVFAIIAQLNIKRSWDIEKSMESQRIEYEVESRTNEVLDQLFSIKTYIETSQDEQITQESFSDYVESITKSDSTFINVSWAPEGVQTYVHPLEGNEDVLGHNLYEDERESVQTVISSIIATKEPQFSGPYPARQDPDTEIIVFRYPVYDNGELRGLVNFVIESEDVFFYSNEVVQSTIYDFNIVTSEGEILYGEENLNENQLSISTEPFDWKINLSLTESYNTFTTRTKNGLNFAFLFFLLVTIYLIFRYQKSNDILEKSVDKLIHYDTVTGLPNRLMFENTLSQSKVKAIAFGDIDNFKYVNDLFGHSFGDDTLSHLSVVMEDVIGKGHVFRWGGDEFVFTFDNNDKDYISNLLDELIKKVCEPLLLNGNEFKIGISIGVLRELPKSVKPADLIKMADFTMYNVKQSGRNGYLFYSEEHSYNMIQTIRFDQLTKSINFDKDTVVFYQPRFSFETNKVVGLEALIRLENNGEYHLPKGFIDSAEANGMIKQLDYSVIERVGLFQKVLESKKMLVPIAVNISAKTFSNSFVAHLRDLVQAETVNPKYIEIEITESSSISLNETTIALLHELKDIGFKFLLDDFGRQYSSLKNLSILPIDVIKIDKEFIDRIDESNTLKIIETIIHLGEKLNLDIIAEGIETIQQYEVMKHLKCTSFQGYLYERAISEADFLKKYIK